jgi:2-polyprenyl-3-methyl-5-hydroxy-6-metoxy-1,4-benzoquinol methylase
MSYNTTQLHPDTALERHVFHRDQFAHVFRWSHVLRRARIGNNVLDVGCGTGNLLELLYRNRFKASWYLGLDVKENSVSKAKEKFKDVDWAQFEVFDAVTSDLKEKTNGRELDVVTLLEVMEHLGKQNGDKILQNIKSVMSEKTLLLVSTPCYSEKEGAADNHMIDGEIGEYTYQEMKNTLLTNGFKVMNHWGTFASISDYKPHLDKYPGLDAIYERMREYYDSNLLSNFMAPLFPEYSRNVLWECMI